MCFPFFVLQEFGHGIGEIGGNQRLRPVRTVQPLAEQIEQACVEAELKSEQLTKAKNDKLPPEQHTKPELRPSKR